MSLEVSFLEYKHLWWLMLDPRGAGDMLSDRLSIYYIYEVDMLHSMICYCSENLSNRLLGDSTASRVILIDSEKRLITDQSIKFLRCRQITEHNSVVLCKLNFGASLSFKMRDFDDVSCHYENYRTICQSLLSVHGFDDLWINSMFFFHFLVYHKYCNSKNYFT